MGVGLVCQVQMADGPFRPLTMPLTITDLCDRLLLTFYQINLLVEGCWKV
jgi:hypothetical protein